MKKLISVILIPAFMIVSFAQAESRAQDWKPQRKLTTQEAFQSLKPGDKIAMNCKKCDSVSMREIESKADAMALCQEGKMVSCPVCKQEATVSIRGPRPENPRREVRFVDKHGETCMVMAKVHEEKADGGSLDRGPETPHRAHM